MRSRGEVENRTEQKNYWTSKITYQVIVIVVAFCWLHQVFVAWYDFLFTPFSICSRSMCLLYVFWIFQSCCHTCVKGWAPVCQTKRALFLAHRKNKMFRGEQTDKHCCLVSCFVCPQLLQTVIQIKGNTKWPKLITGLYFGFLYGVLYCNGCDIFLT